jgi:hypothetical protein
MIGKISIEIATLEIDNWLDKKKVYESTRESQKDNIDLLIESVMRGDITIDETTNEITHKLLFPDAVNDAVREMKYKPRLNDAALTPHLQGVSPKDADGRLLAHVAALTAQPKAILRNLDSADKKIMMSIAVFFL